MPAPFRLQSGDEEMSASLLLALTALAAKLKPVSAESLKAYHSETRPTMQTYLAWAIFLAVIIIPFSILTFISSSISNQIHDDINIANGLVVKLHTELGAEARQDIGSNEQLTDLQSYAAIVRSIYAHSRRLNTLLYPRVPVPLTLHCDGGNGAENANCLKQKFELPYGIKIADFPASRDNITETYQDVRFFAQNITTDVTTYYGAINSCILPILYALLGTCAYLLRSFEDAMSTRTFTPSVANSARFVIAAIGGTVIGLFNGFTSQTSASPLAMAFPGGLRCRNLLLVPGKPDPVFHQSHTKPTRPAAALNRANPKIHQVNLALCRQSFCCTTIQVSPRNNPP